MDAHEVLLVSTKCCVNLWSESGDQEGCLEGLTRSSMFIPSAQALTSLVGALHRSDRCRLVLGFGSGELLVACSFELWCSWSFLGSFRVGLLGFVEVFPSLRFVFSR
jgi:hypothetical protein